MRARGRAGFPAVVIAALLCGCATPRPDGPDPVAQERYARHQIATALAFRSQGRLESAEYALEAALAYHPDNARAHRLLAVVLEEDGRLGAAERHRARADALDPPAPLPDDEAIDLPSGAVLVVLPRPETLRGRESRVAGGWPGGEAVAALQRRLRTRLPDAEIAAIDPATSQEVQELLRKLAPRAVLSLRIDRAYCGDSEKDGPFSVAWLRVAAATQERLAVAPDRVRQVEWIPPPRHCVPLPIARALETVLAREDVRDALRSRSVGSEPWPARTVRALFPGLSIRIARHLERGRARLATGRLNEALESFRDAAAIDPEDGNVRAYLQETELTLAMSLELAGGGELPAERGEFDPQLTAAQRNVAQHLLDEERARRDELLAALLVLDAGGRAPSARALDNLRSVVIAEPSGPGAALARGRSDAPLEVRAYYAPDGRLLANYWFAAGSDEPILREQDSDGDGTPDQWEGYADGARSERWEDRQGTGRPDLHMTFGADGAVTRIEVDGNADGRPERLFRYEDGELASESRDTDDDGFLDRVEHFDDEGYVTLREDDLDADGKPDVRSFYEAGSLVRREILNLELVDELTR